MNEEIYLARNCSAQEVDSDDLAGDLNLSGEEDSYSKSIARD